MFNNISKILALTFSSAYSAGLLVTSIVIVDSWSQMEPAASIEWFGIYGIILGAVMAPLGFLAVAFTLVAFILVVKKGDTSSQKVTWLLALVFTVASMVLLPIYFLEANTAFFDKTIELSQVANAVESWGFWNWIRTGLSLAATTAIVIGMTRKSAEAHI